MTYVPNVEFGFYYYYYYYVGMNCATYYVLHMRFMKGVPAY
jgi:hypothetical protein